VSTLSRSSEWPWEHRLAQLNRSSFDRIRTHTRRLTTSLRLSPLFRGGWVGGDLRIWCNRPRRAEGVICRQSEEWPEIFVHSSRVAWRFLRIGGVYVCTKFEF
jgi:hypothetical protein